MCKRKRESIDENEPCLYMLTYFRFHVWNRVHFQNQNKLFICCENALWYESNFTLSHVDFHTACCCIYSLYLLTKSVTASCFFSFIVFVAVVVVTLENKQNAYNFSIQSITRSNNSRHKLKNGWNTNVKRLKAVRKQRVYSRQNEWINAGKDKKDWFLFHCFLLKAIHVCLCTHTIKEILFFLLFSMSILMLVSFRSNC